MDNERHNYKRLDDMIMKEKLMRFMYGRYGTDSLGYFLMISALVLSLLSGFFDWGLVYILAEAVLVYTCFRMFSRNIYKRSAENQAFLKHTAKIRFWWHSQKSLMLQRKTHHIYKCPTCHQKIRIPKGKGRIEIRCPKCQTTFIKNS